MIWRGAGSLDADQRRIFAAVGSLSGSAGLRPGSTGLRPPVYIRDLRFTSRGPPVYFPGPRDPFCELAPN